MPLAMAANVNMTMPATNKADRVAPLRPGPGRGVVAELLADERVEERLVDHRDDEDQQARQQRRDGEHGAERRADEELLRAWLREGEGELGHV